MSTDPLARQPYRPFPMDFLRAGSAEAVLTFYALAQDDDPRDGIRRGWTDLDIPELMAIRNRSESSIKRDLAWLVRHKWIVRQRWFNNASRTYLNYDAALGVEMPPEQVINDLNDEQRLAQNSPRTGQKWPDDQAAYRPEMTQGDRSIDLLSESHEEFLEEEDGSDRSDHRQAKIVPIVGAVQVAFPDLAVGSAVRKRLATWRCYPEEWQLAAIEAARRHKAHSPLRYAETALRSWERSGGPPREYLPLAAGDNSARGQILSRIRSARDSPT